VQGTKALDAHQSVMSVSGFTFLTMPLAIACAASIRVGNLLGAQRPKQVNKLNYIREKTETSINKHSTGHL
jgi:Na+-driven multidrug efflux pump